MDGIVDGATVDADGCYWLTVPFKGKVMRYDPDGKLMQTIELPVDLPTCCEFGGRDLDMLYVTTRRSIAATRRRSPGRRSPAACSPSAGSDARGVPLVPFAG